MTAKNGWLEQLLRIAKDDRQAAQECLQAVTAFELLRLLEEAADPNHLAVPLLLTVISQERLTELEQLVEKLTRALIAQHQKAIQKLEEQANVIQQAFKVAMEAQTSGAPLPEQLQQSNVYFFQIAIREKRRGRAQYISNRQARVSLLERIVKAEAQRRKTA